MKKTVRHLSIGAIAFCGVATSSVAAERNDFFVPETIVPTAGAAMSFDDVEITVKGNQVRVQNADGLTFDVYNLTGVKVASFRVDSEDKTFTLNVSRGIYIVKVGKVARRVNIVN